MDLTLGLLSTLLLVTIWYTCQRVNKFLAPLPGTLFFVLDYLHIPILKQLVFTFLFYFTFKKNSCESMLVGWNLIITWSMGDISKMEDIYKRWTEYLDSTWSRVNHPPPVNCVFCGGEHFNDNCYLYSMKNSWWG